MTVIQFSASAIAVSKMVKMLNSQGPFNSHGQCSSEYEDSEIRIKIIYCFMHTETMKQT